MVIPWRGVPLKDVLARFEPTSKAKYVAFTTLAAPRADARPAPRRARVALPRGAAHRRGDELAPAARDRHVRPRPAQPERRAAAAGGAVEVRLQGHQVDRLDPARRDPARDHLEHRRADRVRLLREREPRGRPPALDAEARAPDRRVLEAPHAACSTATGTRSPRSTRAWTCARTSEPTPGAPRGGGRGLPAARSRSSRSARCATTSAPTRSRPSRTRPGCGPCASCSRPWP